MYVAGVQTAHTLILSRSISMIIYTIYKSVNRINGKVYIGFDSKWPKRIERHEYNYKNHKQKKHFKFYRALRKYGWNNFIWEVIYQSKDGLHCLQVMESYFIKEYDSFNNGYNMTLGGEGTLGKEPVNKGKKMIPMAENVKNKISISMRGKIKSESHRENLSFALKGKKNGNKKLKTPDGVFLSATEAAKYYGLNRNTMYNRIHLHPEKYQYIK